MGGKDISREIEEIHLTDGRVDGRGREKTIDLTLYRQDIRSVDIDIEDVL